MQLRTLLEKLIADKSLSVDEMKEIMHGCLQNTIDPIQLAAFLALMRMKGETVEELTVAAQVMLEHAHCINLGNDLIDIVGTGGDAHNTINISTASSIVAAAAGISIAKHGSGAFSSKSGSMDFLQMLGISLTNDKHHLQQSLQIANICFLSAPLFHTGLQYIRPIRKQLGIRTFFNLLGPLLNPARVKKQIVGVCNAALMQPLAEVLVHLGSQRFFIVHARDGLDEISIADYTDVLEFDQGHYHAWTIDPKAFDLFHPNLQDIIIDSPQQSIDKIMDVFAGKPGACRDIILLNSGAAIFLGGGANTLQSAIHYAAEAIDSGRVQQCVNNLQQLSRS